MTWEALDPPVNVVNVFEMVSKFSSLLMIPFWRSSSSEIVTGSSSSKVPELFILILLKMGILVPSVNKVCEVFPFISTNPDVPKPNVNAELDPTVEISPPKVLTLL